MASIAAYLLMAISGLAGGATMFMSLQGAGVKPCPKCKKEMMPDWQSCLFCGANPDLESGKPAALHFLSGPFTDQVALLEKPVVTLGSVPGNDIVIPDPSVSRKHVGVRKVEGGYEVAATRPVSECETTQYLLAVGADASVSVLDEAVLASEDDCE